MLVESTILTGCELHFWYLQIVSNLTFSFRKCQPKSEFKFDPKGFGKWIMRQYGDYVIQQVLCEITTLRNLLG